MGVKIVDLAEEIHDRTKVTVSREQLGKILGDKVPGSRLFDVIDRVITELEQEHGHDQPGRGEGQVTIVAKGVYGIQELSVSGSPADAEATMAKLIRDISSGKAVTADVQTFRAGESKDPEVRQWSAGERTYPTVERVAAREDEESPS
jgi:hypothetical protein